MSTTSNVDLAVERVTHRYTYIEQQYAGAGLSTNTAYLAAVTAMDYTSTHVNAAEYGWRIQNGLLPAGGGDAFSIAEPTLAEEAGICGHCEAVFSAIMQRIGLQERQVRIYYTSPDGTLSGGHVTSEVYYGGDWHYFDPTWNAFYRNDLTDVGEAISLDALIQLGGQDGRTMRDRALMWSLAQQETGPSHEWMTSEALVEHMFDASKLRVEYWLNGGLTLVGSTTVK